jgi:hypothetical protein
MDSFSLSAVHLGVTTDMAKDIKELNFGYSNDIVASPLLPSLGSPW